MTGKDYQEQAARTLIDKPDFQLTKEEMQMLYAFGQVVEGASSLAEKLKKKIFHKHQNIERLELSLGSKYIERKAHILSNVIHGLEAEEIEFDESKVMLLWNAIGLVGESGEVYEMIHDACFEGIKLSKENMTDELGDDTWYIAALATKLGIDLDDVFSVNIEKLKIRFPDGFDSQASIDRVDVDG